MNLLRKYWWYVLALLLGAFMVERIYNFGYVTMERKHDQYVAERDSRDKAARLAATEKERTLEQTLQTAVQNTEAAKAEQERLRAVIAIADGTNDRLHDELKATRANLRGQGNYSTLAERSASATRAAMVLSDLFGSCSTQLKELGGAVDQAQSRGRQCERSYNTVRELSNKAP